MIFKNISVRFKNINYKKQNYFVIKKKDKIILSYYQDGLKIKHRFNKENLIPNKNYMQDVYINIYKAINKKKSNYFDINMHLNFIKNVKKVYEV